MLCQVEWVHRVYFCFFLLQVCWVGSCLEVLYITVESKVDAEMADERRCRHTARWCEYIQVYGMFQIL